MPAAAGVHVAMIGNLPHHIVDEKAVSTPLILRNSRQYVSHQGFFGVRGLGPMLSEHGHWRVAGIAIQNGKLEGV